MPSLQSPFDARGTILLLLLVILFFYLFYLLVTPPSPPSFTCPTLDNCGCNTASSVLDDTGTCYPPPSVQARSVKQIVPGGCNGVLNVVDGSLSVCYSIPGTVSYPNCNYTSPFGTDTSSSLTVFYNQTFYELNTTSPTMYCTADTSVPCYGVVKSAVCTS